MKNLGLLGLEKPVHDSILTTESKYRQMMKVRCKVLEYDEGTKTAVVRVEQFAKVSDKVFTGAELVAKGREVFSWLPEGFTVRFRPLLWKGEGLDAVSAEWVKNQLKKHGLYQKDLVDKLGVDYASLSKLLANKYEFTRWHKAAFFYFFKSL